MNAVNSLYSPDFITCFVMATKNPTGQNLSDKRRSLSRYFGDAQAPTRLLSVIQAQLI